MALKTVSEMEGCAGCKMRELFPDNTFVEVEHGTGNRLVIAEAPGSEEQQRGRPLVGGSGKLFDALCRQAGIHRSELSVLNSVNCRPPNNIHPLSSEARSYISKSDAEAAVSQCFRRYVKPVIQGREWERIILLGERALSVITGLTGISRWRGSIIEIDTDKL